MQKNIHITIFNHPPPPPPTTQFTKEEDRVKWEDISPTIDFVRGNDVYGVGGGSVEGRES